MEILFLCTAHNSLSQRLQLVLSTSHDVTIEYAISDEIMISAATLAQPDLIICPFLTNLVPRQLYESWMTLIIHPGPPGDAGPSALDWVLMGDDGSINDPHELLQALDGGLDQPGRTYWPVAVLQAIEEFDAGPVWAFEQFPIDIDAAGMTKSELYRGPITRAAVTATLQAISRIEDAALTTAHDYAGAMKSYGGCGLAIHHMTYSTHLKPRSEYGRLSVTDQLPFQGARQISRRIRSADSQPGVLKIRKELGSLAAKWAEATDVMARAHRRGSVALQSQQAMAHVALPGIERETETVFSCYYQPIDAPLTPPESPFRERRTPVLST
ncbi:hypothetical protein B0A55_04729 [Friedmanniomyces simplex]|uniref:Formyl transferase N-terminal domain-containing protein n=1 Tax=Friedmanniomyces simplex TaxID=329884 RepID=A0A4U0XRZ5_9PEZI|nr:hypothetical protein B0A55_04729 [Friedmanniomyces simplex]